MHSGSRAANSKRRGLTNFDASSRRKKSKKSALQKQLVYYCQVGSWASTDPTPPAHRPAPAVLPGPPQAGPLCLRGIGTKRRSPACPATVAPNGAGRWPGPRADSQIRISKGLHKRWKTLINVYTKVAYLENKFTQEVRKYEKKFTFFCK